MRPALPLLAALLLPIRGNAVDADKHIHAAAGVAVYAPTVGADGAGVSVGVEW